MTDTNFRELIDEVCCTTQIFAWMEESDRDFKDMKKAKDAQKKAIDALMEAIDKLKQESEEEVEIAYHCT